MLPYRPICLPLRIPESNSQYLRYCQDKGVPVHPARFPATIPEFFVRFLTDKGDLVFDPFGGSCVTGEVAERLQRRWICSEIERTYLEGARGRFSSQGKSQSNGTRATRTTYSIHRPGVLWDSDTELPLPSDGGRTRSIAT